jgi:hypothetical protein
MFEISFEIALESSLFALFSSLLKPFGFGLV